MKFIHPIRDDYFGNVCELTQLFGDNKNRWIYGPEGHKGVDFRTKNVYLYEKKNPVKGDGNVFDYWERSRRSELEKKGFIELIASHDGMLMTNIHYRAKQLGWGMFINWHDIDDVPCRLLYWHIETPWTTLKMFAKKMMGDFKPKFVRAGSPVAIAGNSGFPKYSTAPHLHWEFQKKVGGKWVSENPMPYLKGLYVINDYYAFKATPRQYFHDGKKISVVEAEQIISKLPKYVEQNNN